jgi:hypothetical protein
MRGFGGRPLVRTHTPLLHLPPSPNLPNFHLPVKYNRTLIPAGNKGINNKIFQDGRVAILTVRRREKPPSRRELWDAWGELAQVPLKGGGGGVGWFDWEARADVRRARWELEVAEE